MSLCLQRRRKQGPIRATERFPTSTLSPTMCTCLPGSRQHGPAWATVCFHTPAPSFPAKIRLLQRSTRATARCPLSASFLLAKMCLLRRPLQRAIWPRMRLRLAVPFPRMFHRLSRLRGWGDTRTPVSIRLSGLVLPVLEPRPHTRACLLPSARCYLPSQSCLRHVTHPKTWPIPSTKRCLPHRSSPHHVNGLFGRVSRTSTLTTNRWVNRGARWGLSHFDLLVLLSCIESRPSSFGTRIGRRFLLFLPINKRTFIGRGFGRFYRLRWMH